MTRRWGAIAAASALALGLAACAPTAEEPTDDGAATEWPEEIVLGLVPSQEVDQLVLDAEVLGDLLSEELGITVRAEVTDSYNALVVAMQSGQAAIGMFGPIALVQAADQAGAEPILQSVRFGSSTYVTQWFTNDPDRFCETEVVLDAESGPVGESALALIEQDEAISFVDEGSASGYYYPATQLEEAGLDPFALSGSFFAGGHPNSVLSVARGDATVGVSFNDARGNVVEELPTVGEDVVVFAWSTAIPNDGVAVAGDLPQDLKDAITEAFLAIADSEEGLAALDAVYSIEGLVPADLDALDAARQVEANFGE
ncbi:MAG: phosphate/phosphite/phosphonate ABC transporter substrate-binding protein [Microcella pacifica]